MMENLGNSEAELLTENETEEPSDIEEEPSDENLSGSDYEDSEDKMSTEEAEVVRDEKRRGCKHYVRGCSFVSPCCDKIFPCRICHDEQVSGHTLDRHAVVSIVCNKCTQKQAVSNKCTACGDKFGNYFCSICRLYDDVDKGQFHCDGCGLCRVGGQENYIHCDKCGCCLPKDKPHRCVSKSSRNDCPVCLEDLHSSRVPCHILPCGHLLHTTCYENLWKYNIYRCPTCNSSIANLSAHWASLDQAIQNTPMPAEYANDKVWILCNDCHKVSEVLWHVFGLKCQFCGSYNTARDEQPKQPSTATNEETDSSSQQQQEAGPSHQQNHGDGEGSNIQPTDDHHPTDTDVGDGDGASSDDEYESLD